MPLIVILGALVGLVIRLTGAGGGILAVPVLVFGLHLSIAEAGPIGLLAIGIAAAVGAVIGLKSHTVRYRAALLIAGTGILMAPVGAQLTHQLDTRLLSLIFALVLLWVAYKNLKGRGQDYPSNDLDLELPCIRDTGSGRFIWTARCARRLAAAGSIAGILSGLLGIGGGFVMVPAMQRYTNLTMQSIVTTSLAVIALISLAGVVTSMTSGHFNEAVGVPFAGGAIVGMLVGSMLSLRLPARFLQVAFAGICSIAAVAMMTKSLSLLRYVLG